MSERMPTLSAITRAGETLERAATILGREARDKGNHALAEDYARQAASVRTLVTLSSLRAHERRRR